MTHEDKIKAAEGLKLLYEAISGYRKYENLIEGLDTIKWYLVHDGHVTEDLDPVPNTP